MSFFSYLRFLYHKITTCLIILIVWIESLPRSRRTGRFRQENTGNRWNMETVFRPESSSWIIQNARREEKFLISSCENFEC